MSDAYEPAAGLRKAHEKAQDLMRDRERLSEFLNKSAEKARQNQSRVRKFLEEVELLIRMVRAYISGEYRKTPWKAIVYAVAALIYFVNPFDLIPDFFGFIGFLDDATMVGLVISALKDEIAAFRAYLSEGETPSPPEEAAPEPQG